MNRNYFVFIVAAALVCLLLIFVSLIREIESPVTKDPIVPPPVSPYAASISGEGVVEPSTNNILIGTPVNRIVDRVLVHVGEKVKKGDVLLTLENRDLKAELMSQQAQFKMAEAKYQKLKDAPRPEDLAFAEGAMNNAKLELETAKKQYEMVLELPDPRAISQQENDRRTINYQQAQAKWQQAEAEFNKVKVGTWAPDLNIAKFEVEQAKASVNRIQAEIARTIIKSPIDGSVLQIKIHEGESPSFDSSQAPLMILGNIDELYLRVSINQLNAPFFNSKAPAVAYLQDDAKYEYPLEFVRIEPVLTNKQNSTNMISERVDTRVLQVIYRIKKITHPVFVGQQMNVFIEAKHS